MCSYASVYVAMYITNYIANYVRMCTYTSVAKYNHVYHGTLLNCTGTGVDIYILADGIDYGNEEFGGRARDGGYRTLYRQQRCTKYGTEIASVAAGRYSGVAKNSNIYRYVATYILHESYKASYIWLYVASYTLLKIHTT